MPPARADIPRLVLAASLLGLGATRTPAADWPQFLGPNRDGVAPDARIAGAWPAGGPPVLWSKKVGQGFSGPVVAEGVAVLFHRVGDDAVVECLDATSGEPKWASKYPTKYRDDFGFDEGPRATSLLRACCRNVTRCFTTPLAR